MDTLLGDCSLDRLRRRKSFKWRTHEPDVLPGVRRRDGLRSGRGDQGRRRRRAAATATAATRTWASWARRSPSSATDRFGWSPDPGLVFAIPDVMTGIAEVIQALTPPGAGVVINPPVYAPFFFRLELLGRRVVEAPLRAGPDGRYDLDLAALDAALAQPGVGAYLLCNPHNPLGRVWSRRQLSPVAEICARQERPGAGRRDPRAAGAGRARHVPFHTVDHPAARQAVVFSSASKGWNIPGLEVRHRGRGDAAVGRSSARAVGRAAGFAPRRAGLRSPRCAAPGPGWTRWSRRSTPTPRRCRRCWPQQRARDRLPKAAGELPGLAGLPGTRPGGRPRGGVPRPGPGGAEPRARTSARQGRGFARLNMGTSPELLAEAVRRMGVAAAG